MRSKVSALLVVGLTLLPSVLPAQSLGNVAREEAERRKAVKPGKVYTNDSLKKDEPSQVVGQTPSPAGAEAPAPAGAAKAAAAASGAQKADEPKRGEDYWKKRLQDERDAVSRSQLFAESLQTRINSLTTDFVNRDDPAQRAVIASDRDKALAELDRVKKEIATHTKAIADIQEEGRKAGVPAGWLR